jgi:ectoine hydroxylase-related dioxygenase (phytanoyl-CoA dioxygenase family)
MPTQGSTILAAEARAEELRRDGYTLLGPVLSNEVIANLNEEFDRRYAHLTDHHADFENSLQTGNRRYMLTVELSGAFADPAVYANRLIIDVLNIVFEQTLILENCGVALSLPGAKTQHCHRDGLFLFNTGLSALLPSWAVTVGIPLIDMNMEQGTTEIFPGSHRAIEWDESASSIVPDVPAGAVLMWDARTMHRGTENRSARRRPLLYLTYSKPWWRDVVNFEPVWGDSGPVRPQKKILFGKDFLASVPPESRSLFRNADP